MIPALSVGIFYRIAEQIGQEFFKCFRIHKCHTVAAGGHIQLEMKIFLFCQRFKVQIGFFQQFGNICLYKIKAETL